MTVTAPETRAREHLKTLIEAEWPGLTVKNDRLNQSLGQDGDLAATFPNVAQEDARDGLILDTTVTVQMFRKWSNDLDPEETVDPAGIEEWAERLRRAVKGDLSKQGEEHMWYFRIFRVEYNPDPSGNISRLEATIQVSSGNSGLMETTG